ncbi:MAG: hypothetical protein BHW66_11305 [Akkermansia sp. 54_46]|nr:hypothetical protein [Akkermansia sp.]OLA87605.1 MAG: hypothetical protein BHW66_11305 [Akkermansia sp. 54_46]PNC63850.1 hypothetical protein CXU07_03670 [Akkermansia muciniphila]
MFCLITPAGVARSTLFQVNIRSAPFPFPDLLKGMRKESRYSSFVHQQEKPASSLTDSSVFPSYP